MARGGSWSPAKSKSANRCHQAISVYLSIYLSVSLRFFKEKKKKILLPKNTSRRRRKPGWLSEPLELQKKKKICNLLVSLRRLQEKATCLHQSLAYTCTVSHVPLPRGYSGSDERRLWLWPLAQSTNPVLFCVNVVFMGWAGPAWPF